MEEIFGSNDVDIIHGNDSFKDNGGEEEFELESSNNQISQKEKGFDQLRPYSLFDNISLSNDNVFTNNIARAIYEEAKNFALARIEQGITSYYSDSER